MTLSARDALVTTIGELLNFMKDHVFTARADKADVTMIKYHLLEDKNAPDVVELVSSRIVPFSDRLRDRDPTVVDDMLGQSMLSKLPADRSKHLRDLLSGRKPGVSEENRQTLFEYFEHILKIMDKFKRPSR